MGEKDESIGITPIGETKKNTGETKKEDEAKTDYDSMKKKVGAASTIVNESKKIDQTIHDTQVKKQKAEINKKDLSEYSDAELKQLVTRMNMEKQYKTLTAEMTIKGESKVKKFLESTGTALTVANSAITMIAALDALAKTKKK